MKPLDLFSDKNRKIRKQWRIALFIIVSFELLGSLFLALDSKNPRTVFVIISFFLIAVYGLLYYFAYHRQRANCLLISLNIPLLNILNIINGFTSTYEIAGPEKAEYQLIFLGIALALYVWWCFMSFRLYRVHLGFHPSWGCLRAIKEMKNLNSAETLQTKYQTLLSQYPRFRPAIELAYQNKKDSDFR